MKCRLIAAGTRLPNWVNEGFREYQKRLRTPLVLELVEIPVATRRAGENPQRAIAREGDGMLAALGREDYVVALEVAAKSMTTSELSTWANASGMPNSIRSATDRMLASMEKSRKVKDA